MSLVTVRCDGAIAHIGFDRPEKHNALDDEMVSELHAALDGLVEVPSVLVFHSTTPGVFVSGADIARLRQRTGDHALRRINARLFDRIAAHRWPTIAAIDGPALGGGNELAMACDFRVASTRARFGQPELRLGILAGAGANFRLERVAGLSTARRMLLAGDILDASAALAAGLVDELVEPETVAAAAAALATRITENSWQALELTKRALALNNHDTSSFDAAAQALLFESDEKRRRMDDFLRRQEERRTRKRAI